MLKPHRVGAPRGVELGWFAAEREGDRARGGIDGIACATFVPLGENPEQREQGRQSDSAKIEQLPQRADVETGTRSTCRDTGAWRVDDLAHFAPTPRTRRRLLRSTLRHCPQEITDDAVQMHERIALLAWWM